jgi:hypothetical protein
VPVGDFIVLTTASSLSPKTAKRRFLQMPAADNIEKIINAAVD